MKILWIDDDAYDLEYLLYKFNTSGNWVEQIDNIPQAYEVLRSRCDEFDLILLDLMMPRTDRYGNIPDWLSEEISHGENGLHLIRKIRNDISKTITIVVVSIIGPVALTALDLECYAPIEFIRKTPHVIKDIDKKLLSIIEKNKKTS
mgnify:CR=1 FL=1